MSATDVCAEVQGYGFEQLDEGMSRTIEIVVTAAAIGDFAKLSGDVSPIHVDENYAKQQGFRSVVAHGALITSYVSRFVGVHLPGRQGVLQKVAMEFRQPCYAGDRLRITGEITRKIDAVRVIKIAIQVVNAETDEVVANGQVQSGLKS